MIDTLLEALRAEFDDVTVSETLPESPAVPSVVVAPGDPFLEPESRYVQERWSILVVVAKGQPDRGIGTLRDLSLRVRDCASKAGAVWVRTTTPAFSTENTAITWVSNDIYFRYIPEV